MNKKALREELSELEHEQWVHWSKYLALELSNIRESMRNGKTIKAKLLIGSKIKRWKPNWKAYSKLDEPTKDYDREWADKALAIIDRHLDESAEKLEMEINQDPMFKRFVHTKKWLIRRIKFHLARPKQ